MILLQTDSIRCTRNLAEAVPVEKTLSIFELLTSGGLAGNIIMASLF
jgi:biopolymer transport protein ExbB